MRKRVKTQGEEKWTKRSKAGQKLSPFFFFWVSVRHMLFKHPKDTALMEHCYFLVSPCSTSDTVAVNLIQQGRCCTADIAILFDALAWQQLFILSPAHVQIMYVTVYANTLSIIMFMCIFDTKLFRGKCALPLEKQIEVNMTSFFSPWFYIHIYEILPLTLCIITFLLGPYEYSWGPSLSILFMSVRCEAQWVTAQSMIISQEWIFMQEECVCVCVRWARMCIMSTGTVSAIIRESELLLCR